MTRLVLLLFIAIAPYSLQMAPAINNWNLTDPAFTVQYFPESSARTVVNRYDLHHLAADYGDNFIEGVRR